MKTLYFVRHAKSSWADHNLPDHDRPLNKRGKRDAPRMARRLMGLDVSPDGILTSSAKRAKATAKVFREACGLGKSDVITRKTLYHASPNEIEAELRRLPADWKTVLVFGHNPGYTDLANRLQHDQDIDNVPTCGIVGANIEIDDWSDFKLTKARRTTFMYPKQVL